MATKLKPDSQEDWREMQRRLQEALQECRELVKRTQELLEQAYRAGGPSD